MAHVESQPADATPRDRSCLHLPPEMGIIEWETHGFVQEGYSTRVSTLNNRSEHRLPLVCIVGPTAVGKSALALALAPSLDAEIISADSRQVYRRLDVGTAKPTAEEQRAVRHHLIDVVNPEDDFSLAEFQDLAYLAIDGVLRRGRVPLLVGGTGLYVRAVVEGMQLPRVAPDPLLRQSLERYAIQHGAEALHSRLATVDVQAANRIDPRNLRRVIRALEVIEKSGQLFSLGSVPHPRYDVLSIGLTTDRDSLYQQIDARVDWQIENGLVEETRAVLAQGCPPNRPALGGLGYREIVAFLEDRLDLSTAIERVKFETHRFSRQQYNWFRLADPGIHWLTPGPAASERATALIDAHFHNSRQPALEVTG